MDLSPVSLTNDPIQLQVQAGGNRIVLPTLAVPYMCSEL